MDQRRTLGLADIIEESMLLLGAGSTVLYQLALLGVGRGVAEHSTTLTRPVDRLRTTLTYVYVMTKGTQEERDAVARMVNKMHAAGARPGLHGLRPRPPALGGRHPRAQRDLHPREGPRPDAARRPRSGSTATRRSSARRSRCKPEDWPATYADFEKYWDHTLTTQLTSEPLVRDYVRKLLSSKGQPWFLRPGSGLQSLMTRGNLPPEVREVLGLTWSWREQKLYDLFWSVHNLVYPVLPRFVRCAHARLVMRDFRRRMRSGETRHLVVPSRSRWPNFGG